jgi:hypothetical protein
MTYQHPITPPLELKRQWREQAPRYRDSGVGRELWLIDRAAQWGGDKELEACRMEIIDGAGLFLIGETSDRVELADDLRAARRPKPPSLKEQALEDLEQIDGHAVDQISAYVIYGDLKRRVSNIRRALEALPND